MQIIANGLVEGLIIALIGTALGLVFLPTRIYHVSLGSIFAIAPMLASWLLGLQMPWITAVLLTLIGCMLLSVGVETLNHWPLSSSGAAHESHLVSGLGIYIAMLQGAVILWGSESGSLRTGIDSVVGLGVIELTRAQIVAVCVSIIVLATTYAAARLTPLGLLMRAMASDSNEVALRGHSLRAIRLACFGMAGLLCGVGALVMGYDVGYDPYGSFYILLLGVAALIIGGTKSIYGPLLGGILLGIFRAEIAWLVSASWKDALAFALLAGFLVLRPIGLVGRQLGRGE